MRLSDQSACLVPISLSYSLLIYFHPDMQGIPDKMAASARFTGYNFARGSSVPVRIRKRFISTNFP